MLDTLNSALFDAEEHTAMRPRPSTRECLKLVSAAYRQLGETEYPAFQAVEYMPETWFRALPVADTILQVAEDMLIAFGVSTNGTVGGIMDAIGYSQIQMDTAICHCVNGDMISGDRAASNFTLFE